MQKIVICTKYGGFGLSHKGIMKYAEYKGIKIYPFILDTFALNSSNNSIDYDNASCVCYLKRPITNIEDFNKTSDEDHFSIYDVDRSDPALIQTVEQLGCEANSNYARLEIIEIPDGVEWQIEEYDGYEHVAEKHRTWYGKE